MNLLTKTLFCFLLFNIVFVTCPPSEDEDSFNLMTCRMQINAAFDKKNSGFDNFLHAFLYISKESFEGRQAYTQLVLDYCNELLFTALDLNLPYLMNPQEFCRTEYQSKESECTDSIGAMGCDANNAGIICFQHLYNNWKYIEFDEKAHRSYESKHLSDEDLQKAISRGLGDRNLFDEGVMEELSDERILIRYFREQRSYYNYMRRHSGRFCSLYRSRRHNRSSPSSGCSSGSNNDRYRFYDLSDMNLLKEFFEVHSEFYDYAEVIEYELSEYRFYLCTRDDSPSTSRRNSRSNYRGGSRFHYDSDDVSFEDPLDDEYVRRIYRHNVLKVARSRKYGLHELPFAEICQELARRESLNIKKPFGNYYIMYQYNRMKTCDITDRNKFKDRIEYCNKIYSQLQSSSSHSQNE